MGMVTAHWELEYNKCVGPDFQLTWLQRILLAGRTAWFQLGSLFWPVNLTLLSRWQINAGDWRHHVFRWLRHPCWPPPGHCGVGRVLLAALLYFGERCCPCWVFSTSTRLYTFVADHYQYLASLGIIALGLACAALPLKLCGLG